MKDLRFLHLVGATGKLRTANFQDAEHIVVPTVALVEGVVRPGNIDRPELVLAKEFSKTYIGWNGRPAMAGHPENAWGEKISANDPTVLERDGLGMIFNTAVDSTRLMMEGWINPRRAKPDTPAARILTRIEKYEPIEVSVGALITSELTPGIHLDGRRYDAIWREIVPDHVAYLDGEIGACSLQDGCGALRANSVHLVTASGLRLMSLERVKMAENTPPPERKSFRDRLLDLITFQIGKGTASDVSDQDLRRRLDAALRATELGYLGVEAVFPADSLVVYSVMPGDRYFLKQRSYSVSADGAKLKDDAQEVELKSTFEPVRARTANEPSQQPTTASCGCANKGESEMKTKAQRIQALVDSKRFTETDKTWLENVPEDRLAAIETVPAAEKKEEPLPAQSQQPPAQNQSAAVQPNPPAVSPTQQNQQPQQTAASAPQALTVDQYIGQAPPELQESLREGMRAASARRETLLKTLKDSGRCDFTEEQLKSKSTVELESLVKLAAIPAPTVDYSGRAAVSTTSSSKVPKPPSLIEAIQKSRAKAS